LRVGCIVDDRNLSSVNVTLSDIRTVAGETRNPHAAGALLLEPYLSLSDDELVELVRRSDASAFEILMRRYNRRLFRIARSILRNDDMAEDAVQEAYIKAFTHLDRYVPAGRFGSWLGKVAVNEALMLKRGARTRADALPLDSLSERELAHSDWFVLRAADPIDNIQARQLLELAIDALPETFRTVFMLRVVEQLSISEVAECLSLNESTVKTRMHRAQRALHGHLAQLLDRERLSVFEFEGARCDRIVSLVLARCFPGRPP
jgi:RNA polymerase sigma-70 factor, ECF subfamily